MSLYKEGTVVTFYDNDSGDIKESFTLAELGLSKETVDLLNNLEDYDEDLLDSLHHNWRIRNDTSYWKVELDGN